MPRLAHVSQIVGSKVLVRGGWTKDFSEKSRQHLSSVVELFDPYSELWEQKQVEGDIMSPGTHAEACASVNNDLFTYGGVDGGGKLINALRKLDTKTWRWRQLSPQNAEGAPIPKVGCGMVAFGDSLGVFGGHGIPRGPTQLDHLSRTPDFLMVEGGPMSSTSTTSLMVCALINYKVKYLFATELTCST